MARNYRPGENQLVTKAPKERIADRKVGIATFGPNIAPEAKRDVRLYRAWADSNEWIRSAINFRKNQVSSAPWDITHINPDEDFDAVAQMEMLSFFSKPNPKTDSLRTVLEQIVEDLLVLDAGTAEVVHTLRGKPAQMWPIDGAQVRVSKTWQGDPLEPRYFWYPNGRFSTALLDRDVLYLMQNPSTHRVLGLSPLETLREAVDAEMISSRYNKGQVMQAPPAGIIDLGEDASVENVDQFEKYWRAEIAGAKATAVIGGTKDAKFINFGRSQRDMQFLQWQTYLIRKIAAVYQISPQDLGILFDVNRANATTQAESSEDRGLRPLINLIENHFNREIVAEWTRTEARRRHWSGEFDGERMKLILGMSYLDPRERAAVFKQVPAGNLLNLHFRFKIPSGRSATARAVTHKTELSGMPYNTIDSVRDEELLPPVEGGNEIIIPTPIGPMRLSAITGAVEPSPVEKVFMDAAIRAPSIAISDVKPSDHLQDEDASN